MKQDGARTPTELRQRAIQMRYRAERLIDPVEARMILALADAYEQVALARETGEPAFPSSYIPSPASKYFENLATYYRAIAVALASDSDRKQIEAIAAKYELRALESRKHETATADEAMNSFKGRRRHRA